MPGKRLIRIERLTALRRRGRDAIPAARREHLVLIVDDQDPGGLTGHGPVHVVYRAAELRRIALLAGPHRLLDLAGDALAFAPSFLEQQLAGHVAIADHRLDQHREREQRAPGDERVEAEGADAGSGTRHERRGSDGQGCGPAPPLASRY